MLDNFTAATGSHSLISPFEIDKWGQEIFVTTEDRDFGPPPYILKWQPFPVHIYDYIVIGGGSSGSVVASRLSENSSVRVLVLEAGEEETGFSATPIFWGLHAKTKRDFGYMTTKLPNAALGLNGQSIPVTQGKCIGGGSCINGMIYMHGNPEDYDRWASQGGLGWSWPDIFPYMVKSEGLRDDPKADRGYHGTKGPMTVIRMKKQFEFEDLYLQGVKEAGYKEGDYNGADQARFDYIQLTIRDGSRCSAARAYLSESRPNLDILLDALVTKILIDDSKRAYGVQFTRFGVQGMIFATREIIVAAGAYNTPKLLMLSGIGPASHLHQHGIPVVVDSPGVGQNYQDHAFSIVPYTISSKVGYAQTLELEAFSQILEYTTNKTGFMSSTGTTIQGYLRTKYAKDSRPDIQIHQTISTPKAFSFNLKDSVTNEYISRHVGEDILTLLAILVRPQSKGRIELQSANPLDPPRIDPNVFSHPDDMKTMVEAVMAIRKIMNTTIIQEKLGAVPFENTLPGCSSFAEDSYEFVECLIRTLTYLEFHCCCTAKMGSSDDPMAVVDHELRVKGVENLRIVDASVWPEVVTGNTMAAAIAVGERAADVIKGEVLEKCLPPFQNEDHMLSSYKKIS
ncbi:L-sorbose 1-dehydrogenase-like [Brevipalpus obovatus]|uniref:L-sorbose 1-dehydrogenase-like n=1 Tax=Brevipalpus obovatus TaxID=246614 RepID=UPI003D9F7677